MMVRQNQTLTEVSETSQETHTTPMTIRSPWSQAVGMKGVPMCEEQRGDRERFHDWKRVVYFLYSAPHQFKLDRQMPRNRRESWHARELLDNDGRKRADACGFTCSTSASAKTKSPRVSQQPMLLCRSLVSTVLCRSTILLAETLFPTLRFALYHACHVQRSLVFQTACKESLLAFELAGGGGGSISCLTVSSHTHGSACGQAVVLPLPTIPRTPLPCALTEPFRVVLGDFSQQCPFLRVHFPKLVISSKDRLAPHSSRNG